MAERQRFKIGKNEEAIINLLKNHDVMETQQILDYMESHGVSNASTYITLKNMRDKKLVGYDIGTKVYFLPQKAEGLKPEEILDRLAEERKKSESPTTISDGEKIILNKISGKKMNNFYRMLHSSKHPHVQKAYDFLIGANVQSREDRVAMAINLLFQSDFTFDIPLLLDTLRITENEFLEGIKKVIELIENIRAESNPFLSGMTKEELAEQERKEREMLSRSIKDLKALEDGLNELNRIFISAETMLMS